MKIIYRRCAGLDVHEKSVFVCARIMRGKEVESVEATFSTFTEDLEELKARAEPATRFCTRWQRRRQ